MSNGLAKFHSENDGHDFHIWKAVSSLEKVVTQKFDDTRYLHQYYRNNLAPT